ncbi:MAG: S8 family serine peptidase [Magnetococcus sp. YQC-5]
MSNSNQYILLPKGSLRAENPTTKTAMAGLPFTRSTHKAKFGMLEAADNAQVKILDAFKEDGPRLVEMDEWAANKTNAASSPLRAVPIVIYEHPNPKWVDVQNTSVSLMTQFKVICVDAKTKKGIADAMVVAVEDYSKGKGSKGVTDSTGTVHLSLSGVIIQRLYVYSPLGYWSAYRTNLHVTNIIQVDLTPIDLNFHDALRTYYPTTRFDPGMGVTVGVIDTGSGPHQDLNIVSGRNTVTGEPATDFFDADDHGTHVAGLIGAKGHPPTGLQGMAPNVKIIAYRVFGKNAEGASNYAILKAMMLAAEDGCDIINLSLGGGPFDEIVAEAIEDARNNGMLVVVAAGNQKRNDVTYPAAYSGATAVSAMGKEGTYPVGSISDSNVLRPPVSVQNPSEFIADFSNIGPEIAVTGLGVGVLSTLPHNHYGPMSGTSMAAPQVAGAVASLLSQNAKIFKMPRDRKRSNAIEKLLQTNCVSRGFGLNFEGYGLPNPQTV